MGRRDSSRGPNLVPMRLLQRPGFFGGGVSAVRVDNAIPIAAATLYGQAALTAEFKLNDLAPAVGDRLICRAWVLKPGRRITSVAADGFYVSDGVEIHTAAVLASIAMMLEAVEPQMQNGPA